MESIKNKIAIVGMGCTAFGEHWDKGQEDLIIEAAFEAFADAGIGPRDVQAAWVGTIFGATGLSVSDPLKLDQVPVTRVENACASGVEALRNAAFAVAAKVYDVALVIGFEKLKDAGFAGLIGPGTDKWHPTYGAGANGTVRYALAATRYFARYGLSPDEGKRLIGQIAVKSHYNGARNPRAHLRREVTLEQVINAPMIAWPLGLYDCCGVTDGGAAAVICRTEDAKRFRSDYVTIKGISVCTGAGLGKSRTDYDFTHWDETEYAAAQAYAQAGIKHPRKELSMVECHDCFSIAELIACESLGIWERGAAKEEIASGTNTLHGELPVNASGGLKAFGHPIGASGLREIYEIYKQIQGKAENPERQLKGVELGLAHNQGGHPGRFTAGVTIIGAP